MKHKKNNLKHYRKVQITQRIQEKARMGEAEDDSNGLKLVFLKTVQANSFSKFISVASNFKNKRSGYVFACQEAGILSFISNFFC